MRFCLKFFFAIIIFGHLGVFTVCSNTGEAARPEWPGEVLEKAHVTHVITDPYTDPLLDARSTFGEEYRAVMRINALALGWHPDSADHNGNRAHDFAERLGMKLRSFDDFEDLLERLVTSLGSRSAPAAPPPG